MIEEVKHIDNQLEKDWKKRKSRNFSKKKTKRIERNNKRNKTKMFLNSKEHEPLDQKDSSKYQLK